MRYFGLGLALLLAACATPPRWAVIAQRPLAVWIQPNEHSAEVRAAFDAWTALGIPDRFTFVEDSLGADVHVEWRRAVRPGVTGLAWRRTVHGRLVRGRITLATNHANGTPIADGATHALALHEVGHLIGLGHSKNPHAIMAPLVRATTLTHEDRERTKRLK